MLASNVGNIKLGIVSNGGITVNSDPQEEDGNGATSNGHFGIESSSDFNASKTTGVLARHFPGLCGTGTSNDNTVAIGSKNESISDYIYLDIEVGSSNLNAGNGSYKIFFDYS
jgi:hypothetical protein